MDDRIPTVHSFTQHTVTERPSVTSFGEIEDVGNLTRALEGGLRITPSGGGGGHIMPPPSISAPMRASATNFGGYLGPY